MKRVTGIGGVFFKCQDPQRIREWYGRHLGLNMDRYGANFEWRHAGNPRAKGYTQWSPFKHDTDYFEPSTKEFMVNFRVENLEGLLDVLRREGVTVIGQIQSYDYGKFAHIVDPEGNKIELWEPIDTEYEKLVGTKVTS